MSEPEFLSKLNQIKGKNHFSELQKPKVPKKPPTLAPKPVFTASKPFPELPKRSTLPVSTTAKTFHHTNSLPDKPISSRINSELVSVLSNGPPKSYTNKSKPVLHEQPKLDHTTKRRTRGPQRKLPTSLTTSVARPVSIDSTHNVRTPPSLLSNDLQTRLPIKKSPPPKPAKPPASALDQPSPQTASKPAPPPKPQALKITTTCPDGLTLVLSIQEPLESVRTVTNKPMNYFMSRPKHIQSIDSRPIKQLFATTSSHSDPYKTVSKLATDKFIPTSFDGILDSSAVYRFEGPNKTYVWVGRNVYGSRWKNIVDSKDITVLQGQEPEDFVTILGRKVVVSALQPISSGFRNAMFTVRPVKGRYLVEQIEKDSSMLCSGFAHLVSDTQGIFYCWKGRGCSPDDSKSALEAARMIKAHKVVSVLEGAETEDFMHALNIRTPLFKYGNANAWMFRSKCTNNSVPRLFVFHDNAIMEHSYYSAEQLQEDRVYFLDAFVDMYVLIGPQCAEKAPETLKMLQFAAEYSKALKSTQARCFNWSVSVLVSPSILPADLKPILKGVPYSKYQATTLNVFDYETAYTSLS
ncbi:hypothetical protein CANCADRAFT_46010 [Tortispora caseinolytica NRRL Y-17796]|uniref:Gelsolin-like domain-containing protein n=1 Tax=Tortispora caseinolytica NRRL Y-17796 TaxID=767744 RepID=A0A1E4TCU2_9ASCO|nr:hypothetical protein CANCADRAFT_46010 [Tortispora caseinolytica NRRL Y-17796]